MTDTPQVPEDVVARFQPRTTVFSGGKYDHETFAYQLLEPTTAQAGEKLPLVLFLHGLGECGDDNRLQLMYLPEQMSTPAWRERYPCYFIAPQCRLEERWITSLSPSVPVRWGEGPDERLTTTEQLSVVEQILDTACAELPIDLDRVYLTGLSMGGYGSWLHGEAVAIGMAAAGEIAVAMGLWSRADQARQLALIDAAGLPRHWPQLDPEAVLRCLQGDKKVREGRLRFVLPTAIGSVEIRDDVERDTILEALRACAQGSELLSG